MSLMSDNVHPSENGYQLMALNWFEHIKNIPLPSPPKPTNIHTVNKTQTFIEIAWDESIAKNLSHWVIEFSFFNKDLNYTLSTTNNSYKFNFNPFANASRYLYYRIKAVNYNQISSEFSEIHEIKIKD